MDDENLLINAIRDRDLERVRNLLLKSSDVNRTLGGHFAALSWATLYGHLEIASLLIESGANINHQTKDGRNALHFAAAENHISIVSLLIEKGADVNIQSNNGFTPLFRAAIIGSTSIVSLLLQNGADASLLSNNGKTASDWARHYNQLDCVALLENYEHFHRFRKVWLSFSTSLNSFQDNQNQESKHSQIQIQSQSPSLRRMMDSSDLVRYVTEYM